MLRWSLNTAGRETLLPPCFVPESFSTLPSIALLTAGKSRLFSAYVPPPTLR